MCMEDIQLGRKSGGASRNVLVQVGQAPPICVADPMRTVLTISSDGVNLVLLIPPGHNKVGGAGIALSAGTPVITMKVEDWGNLVTGTWTAQSGVNTNITVVEVSLEQLK